MEALWALGECERSRRPDARNDQSLALLSRRENVGSVRSGVDGPPPAHVTVNVSPSMAQCVSALP